MSAFLDLLAQRVVVYDGATGTYLQQCGLTADDFGGIAVYLASSASGYTSGEQFVIDGSYTKF